MLDTDHPLAWTIFLALVAAMLAIDLGAHRREHVVPVRAAAIWSAVWIGAALAFAGGLLAWLGADDALAFLTGYLIEKSLSIDNLFVFLVLFSSFAVPERLQRRVLFWGVAGAIVMRAAFILAGSALLERFHWILYVFGALLVLTAGKLLVRRTESDPRRSFAVRAFAKLVPTVNEYRGARFTVVEGGRRYATPLLAVLVAIEATDVLFAVDSIPAVFAVTEDPFLVFTSNIFALLGLRSLYFVLARALDKLVYLRPALALVLAFVGLKMLAAGVVRVPIAVSLLVIAAIVGGAIVLSLARPGERRRVTAA